MPPGFPSHPDFTGCLCHAGVEGGLATKAQRIILLETGCTSIIPGGMTYNEAYLMAPALLRTMQLAVQGLKSE